MAGTEIIDTIVRALNEDAEGPRQRISEIVQAVGEATALELLAETQRIEETGGELVKKGSRRRTPGGVFFRLAKASVTAEARRKIFHSPHKPKPKQEQPPPRPVAAPVAAQKQAPKAPEATVVVRPRRRVVELGSIRRPETPQPPPPENVDRRWGRPVRATATNLAEKTRRAPEADPARAAVQVPIVPRAAQLPSGREAAQQIRQLLSKMEAEEARQLVVALNDELAPRSEPKSGSHELRKASAAEAASEEGETRERVLATLVQDLSLGVRDLARALYGDESPAAVRRAQRTLEARRKSR